MATALLLVGGCGVATAQAPTAELKAAAPSLRVVESNLDLGTVRAGQEAVGTFVFRNDGEVPVRILSARPG